MSMPQTTSAISLFPSTPSNSASASTSNYTTAQASDISFQETLQSVSQRNATPLAANKPDKPVAKDNDDSDDGDDSNEVKSSKKPGKSGGSKKPKGKHPAEANAAAIATKGQGGAEAETESETQSDHPYAEAQAETKGTAAQAVDPHPTAAAHSDATALVTPIGGKSRPAAAKTSGGGLSKSRAVSTDKSVKSHETVETKGQTDQTTDGDEEQQQKLASNTDSTAADADKTSDVSARQPKTTSFDIGTGKVKSAALAANEDNQHSTAAAAAAATAAPDATDDTQATSDAAAGDELNSLAGVLGGDRGRTDASSDDATSSPSAALTISPFAQHTQNAGGSSPVSQTTTTSSASAEASFIEANHPKIVTGVHGQLLPNGGTMQIRLDPPELGALQVTVHMRDGVMTAAFETSNDDATRMLSHSLNQLKSALESTAGISVEKLHVQQSSRQESHGQGGDQQQQSNAREQQQEARQEQQRRELLQRMWRRLAGGGDPLDLVA
jgi:flagellar hook-length control protein FliK